MVESWIQNGYKQVKTVTMGVDFSGAICYNTVRYIKLVDCVLGRTILAVFDEFVGRAGLRLAGEHPAAGGGGVPVPDHT